MVPEFYGDPSISGHRVAVSRGPNRIDLELVREDTDEPEDDPSKKPDGDSDLTSEEPSETTKPKGPSAEDTIEEIIKRNEKSFGER